MEVVEIARKGGEKWKAMAEAEKEVSLSTTTLETSMQIADA